MQELSFSQRRKALFNNSGQCLLNNYVKIIFVGVHLFENIDECFLCRLPSTLKAWFLVCCPPINAMIYPTLPIKDGRKNLDLEEYFWQLDLCCHQLEGLDCGQIQCPHSDFQYKKHQYWLAILVCHKMMVLFLFKQQIFRPCFKYSAKFIWEIKLLLSNCWWCEEHRFCLYSSSQMRYIHS